MANPPALSGPLHGVSVALGWGLLVASNSWFALQSPMAPEPKLLLVDAVACLVLGACQLGLFRGVLRHPAWVSVVAVLLMATSMWASEPVAKALMTVGVVGTGWLLAQGLLRMGRLGLGVAVLLVPLSTTWVRSVVIDKLTDANRVWLEIPGVDRIPEPATDKPPVVLITVDTLRADSAMDMQAMAWFRKHGVVWDRAMATSSWTLPSMASIMTGRTPQEHGAHRRRDWAMQGIAATVPTIAEELDQAGYSTAAFVTNTFLGTSLGFGRGFDQYTHAFDHPPHRLLIAGFTHDVTKIQGGQYIMSQALDWVEQAPESGWFLWVHLLDPHSPPEHLQPEHQHVPWQGLGNLAAVGPMDSEARQLLVDTYEHEVSVVDEQVMKLLKALEQRGVMDAGGLVVLTADHGEEFWEHQWIMHGHAHWSEVLDVPLGVAQQGLHTDPGGVASLVDVAPTLRAHAGLAPEGLDLRKGIPQDRVATAFGNVIMQMDRSARNRETKVIIEGDGDVLRFDLTTDPTEQHRLEPVDDEVMQAAQAIEDAGLGATADVNVEQLKALGYLE